jgi:hypothetical protein
MLNPAEWLRILRSGTCWDFVESLSGTFRMFILIRPHRSSEYRESRCNMDPEIEHDEEAVR